MKIMDKEQWWTMEDNGGKLKILDNENYGQRTMVDNGQGWRMDIGGQWTMVDNRQMLTIDNGEQWWTMVDS